MQQNTATLELLTRVQSLATTLRQITTERAQVIAGLKTHEALRELEHYAYIVNHLATQSTFITMDAEGTAHVFTFNTLDNSFAYETLAAPER